MNRKLSLSILAAFLLLGILAFQWPVQAAGGETLEGTLSIIYGDSVNGETQTLYILTTVNGTQHQLTFSDAVSYADVRSLNGQMVSMIGVINPQDQESTVESMYTTDSITFAGPEGAQLDSTEAVTPGSYPFISLLCRFPDSGGTELPLSYFTGQYSNSFPGLSHYWYESSYGRFDLDGSTAVNWKTLPQNKAYYHDGTSLNHELLMDDCTAQHDADVNFSNYEGINMMFDENFLQNYAWGGTNYECLDGTCRVWPVTWEPPWGWGNNSILSHETGHAFGLPHSSAGNTVYMNSWDVMSENWNYCNKLHDSTYGCLGQHTIGYHKEDLGVFDASRIQTVDVGEQATITMERMALPQTSNVQYVKVPIGNTDTYYTVEIRTDDPTSGYDQKVPDTAVILHYVNPSDSMPADLVDADGNTNSSDDGAKWLVGETFTDATNEVSITVLSQISTGFVVQIENQYTAPAVETPILESPEDDSYAHRYDPTFEWEAVSGATSYTFEYSQDETFSTSSTETTVGTSITLPELAIGEWFWHVQATDGVGDSLWSSTWSVTIVDAPTLLGPSEGSSMTDHTPNFVWDDFPGAVSYVIQVSPTIDFSILPINHTVTNSFFAPGIAMINQTYYWRVIANTGTELSEWSEIRTLTITGPPGNAQPQVISPDDGGSTTDTTPTFDWEDVDTAVRYRIQMSLTPGFGEWLVNQTITSSEFTPGVTLNPGTYYWRVQAEGNGDSSWFSVKRSITITND